ncbi:MAG: KEOPS complex subunit Pcc1 [Nitrososphaerales archaeon]
MEGISAKAVFHFKNSKTAKAINAALLPDNVNIPNGMKIVQESNGDSIEIKIEIGSNLALETLISTLDEFVSHISSVTQTLDRIETLNDRHKDSKRFAGKSTAESAE